MKFKVRDRVRITNDEHFCGYEVSDLGIIISCNDNTYCLKMSDGCIQFTLGDYIEKVDDVNPVEVISGLFKTLEHKAYKNKNDSISHYMSKLSIYSLISYEKEIAYLHEYGSFPSDSKVRELKNELREATNCPITIMNMERIIEHEIARRWLNERRENKNEN